MINLHHKNKNPLATIKPWINWCGLLLIWLLLVVCCKTPESEVTGVVPDRIDFNFHVRPILSDRCYKCHGPDENARKANLRLDIKEGAFALVDSAENRYAIVPGDLGKSHLIKRVSSDNPDYMMPPPESKLDLAAHEIEILKRWIEQGASWKEHWAFIPPGLPEIPEVSDTEWPKNPIDNFILSRLDQQNLKSSPQASKEKLIRRLSFDLRGIPPKLIEIDNFLSDDSPEAYEKLVDEFLASTDYGERLALEWLDLARYADSHGYQDDLERTMWPWRDWVISAFNSNMPYNQFVTWQLAGDLIPDAKYEQILATGFNRNHKITQEVGVVNEEYRVEYVLDRVNTFSTSFLGLTIGCAQCHDHKFDPISQQEFYSLFSFFNNVPESGRVDYGMKIAEPSIPLPDSTVRKYTGYIKQLATAQARQVESYEQTQWDSQASPPTIEIESNENGSIPAGLKAYYSFDYVENGKSVNEVNEKEPATVINGVVPRKGKFSGGLDFSGENFLELRHLDEVSLKGPVSISFWLYTVENGARGTILAPKGPVEGHKSGFELSTFDDGIRLSISQYTNPNKKGGALSIQTSHVLPGNRWVQVVLTYDGTNKAKGVKIYLNGQPLELMVTKDSLGSVPLLSSSIMVGKSALRDGFRATPQGLFRARLDELMLFNRVLSAAEVEQLAAFHPLQVLQKKKIKSDHDLKRLFYHYLHNYDPRYQEITRWLSEYKYREMKTEHLVVKPTMVMAEMDTVRPAYVLDRGLYSAPGERVYPATPKRIMTFAEGLPKNRLGLARWLFDKNNPLTSRVAVNRYWQMIFGRGIVSTPEDFGSQGDLPSHPELLDWLAIKFESSGWDLKQLLKLMVMSSTYRQSVAVRPELNKQDPTNILLARGPQVRLPAEIIRDHALSISGLLSDKVGGPSVNPYQPKGLWLQVASGNQELKEYIQGHGQDLYRKSMYTFWKRSLPPPSMIIFDAATREQCAVERQPTSTPMQALVLLNDPQFTESSRLMAQRMLIEGGSETSARIRFAFRLATSRQPDAQELELLLGLFNDQLKVFEKAPDRAKRLLMVGEYGYDNSIDLIELATYTVVANAIFNLTETILKG
jgi:hypothetical protein